MAKEIVIKSESQFRALMAERKAKSDRREVRTEAMTYVRHAEIANQAIKVVNCLNIDQFVKKVMTLRILGPLMNGRERTHISIALELGATIDDVQQAEEYGVQIIEEALQKASTQEFIDEFNKNKKVADAVKEMGKTG